MLTIRPLQATHVTPISAIFCGPPWHKPNGHYDHYRAQQNAGHVVVLTAWVEADFAGYLKIVWQTDYPPFRAAGIPEIQDFNVVSALRRQGIGTRLMDAAEQKVADRSPIVGIGVGLYGDYGTAQRMYVRRGYLPDGRGVCVKGIPVPPGVTVRVDDDLVLYFTKQLR